MWFIYTMEYYLTVGKNEILPFATTWLELEGIMLSEISPSEKDRYHTFSPYEELEKLNRRPWGKGRGKYSFKQRQRQTHKRLLSIENKLRVDGGVGGEQTRGENR